MGEAFPLAVLSASMASVASTKAQVAGFGYARGVNAPMGYRKKGVQRLRFYGRSSTFTGLADDLVDSDAYRALTPTQRDVLNDMLRFYRDASRYDTVDLRDVGFTYPFSLCRVMVSSRALYQEILPALVAHGFFECPPLLREPKIASAKRNMPSRRWETYRPSAKEGEKLEKYRRKKAQQLARDKRRKVDFLTSRKSKDV